MDRTPQPARTGLIHRLKPHISRINFYRLCQYLEQAASHAPPLGSSANPADDPVRFRPHPGMGFPVSELKAIEHHSQQPEATPTIRTTFLGLYGVDSPLPTAYLDDIAQGKDGHEAVMAFLDIFNHRFTTQYYRIWRKYNYPASFELGARDAISRCLLGLIGLGIPGSENHIATPVERDAPANAYSGRRDSVSGTACAKDPGNGDTTRSAVRCTANAGLPVPNVPH